MVVTPSNAPPSRTCSSMGAWMATHPAAVPGTGANDAIKADDTPATEITLRFVVVVPSEIVTACDPGESGTVTGVTPWNVPSIVTRAPAGSDVTSSGARPAASGAPDPTAAALTPGDPPAGVDGALPSGFDSS